MATTQNFNYPSSSDVTITGIGNPIGQPYPTSAVAIAGDNPEGNLTPVAVTDDGAVITSPATGSVQHVIVDSSALPTGASTLAAQTTGNTSLATIATNTTGVSTAANQVTGNNSLATIATNTTGIATAALQTTGNTSLSDIDSKTPALGQALAAASVPVVLPAAQITALTPPTTVTVIQPTGTNLHVVVDSAPASTLPTGASTSALQSSTQGATTGGTAATASTLAGGLYNPAQTTLTTGQQVALQTNNLGYLQVASGFNTASITSIAGTGTPLSIHQAAVTVGTTAVRLTTSGSTPNPGRLVLVATPDNATASTVTFYIGSSTVTNSGSTRGIEIAVGQTFIANNDAGDYWIVASVAGTTVTIMEQF